MIPAASKTCSSVFETRDSGSIRFDGDKAAFDNYVAECGKFGYTVDEIKEAKKYEAYNAEGVLHRSLSERFRKTSGDQSEPLRAEDQRSPCVADSGSCHADPRSQQAKRLY